MNLLDLFTKKIRDKGFQEGWKASSKSRHNDRIAASEMECVATEGNRYIAVTNEWENPVVGVVVDVSNFSGTYLSVIYDEISKSHRAHSVGVMIPYSEGVLKAVVDHMTPYERWTVVTQQILRPITESKYPDQYKSLLSSQEIIDILKDSKLFNSEQGSEH